MTEQKSRNPNGGGINTQEFYEVMKVYFCKQIILATEFDRYVFKERKPERVYEIYPLVAGVVTAGRSITILAEQKLVAEVFVLFRAFLERCLNLCYLVICDRTELQNYIDYSLQKGYRSALSKAKTAEIVDIQYNIPSPKGALRDKINKFTSPKGREIRRWSKLSFEEQLSYLRKETADIFSSHDIALYKNIYEDASESSHGTLYGVLAHTGILSGIVCPKKGEDYITLYLTQSFFNLGLLIDKILKIISTKTDDTVTDFIKKSVENAESWRKL